jgi:lysophospholipase L1-like esterase
MPFGDSLTYEYWPGYRGYLYQWLKNYGMDVDFVGRWHDMPENGGDPDHSGLGGYVIGPGGCGLGNLYDNLDAGLKILDRNMDIICLMIGTNDLLCKQNNNPAIEPTDEIVRLEGVLDKIWSVKPDVRILVATVPPVSWNMDGFGKEYNAKIPTLVRKEKEAGKLCYFVNVRDDHEWNAMTDIREDGVHLTAAGYKKVAESFYMVLAEQVFKKSLGENPVLEYRDPYLWPFSETSIWNMPIGDKAKYVPANLSESDMLGMDEDYIVMTPDEPLMGIYENNAGWSGGDRCAPTGGLLFSAPIPQSWEVSPKTWEGNTPNAGLAVLMPDGKTVKQTQPFAHCTVGGPATSQYVFKDENLYGEGYYGAHGGSNLSALGGCLHVGELTPSSGPVRHALKVTIWGKENLFYDKATGGYRWPAPTADAGAPTNYKGTTEAVRMGALLAIPANVDISALGLKTQPAKIIAQALQDYGAYIVDDAAWDWFGFATEWGPNGRFADEFEKTWGFSFSSSKWATGTEKEWYNDIVRKILPALQVVDNNSETTIGGGGRPRQDYAPPFMKK